MTHQTISLLLEIIGWGATCAVLLLIFSVSVQTPVFPFVSVLLLALAGLCVFSVTLGIHRRRTVLYGRKQ